MAFLLSTILVILLEVQGTSCLWTVSQIAAKSGGSVTIPCHYHRKHMDHLKYWCKGRNWSMCMIMRPSNQKGKRPGISFHNNPDELVMTMTMTNLGRSDSDRYWCAVKIGGLLQADIKTSLELTVTEGVPDLSVASNMVSSEEGGNVTVQCLYSKKLRDADKKWCRSGDLHSCQTAKDVEASPEAGVQINDTNDGVFRVILTGLKKTDAGWYWCVAGGLQAPVHINVTSVQLTTTNTRLSTHTMAPWSSYSSTNSDTLHPTNSSVTFSDVHNSEATLSTTTLQLPESTSDKTIQIYTASPERSDSMTHSSTYPITINHGSSHCGGTVMTLQTSGSTTKSVGSSNSPVTVSSKEPKSTFVSRDFVWVIVLVLLILPVIPWTFWLWHKKAKARKEATEICTELIKMI